MHFLPTSKHPEQRPRIVILGASFAGLAAARGLRRAPVDVVIVDRANHHTFQPLLYQVATVGLSAPQIASPIRHILRKQRNVRVLLGEAVDIDLPGRRVLLADGEVGFDYLIVGTGVTHSYFGNDAWAPHAPGLKTLDDAPYVDGRVPLDRSGERTRAAARRRSARASYMTYQRHARLILMNGSRTNCRPS